MKKWNKDYGLQFRMVLTIFLLAVVYLFFLTFIGIFIYTVMYIIMHDTKNVVSVWNIIVSFVAFITILSGLYSFAQFHSDSIALKCMGAKIVSEQEEPHLHETVSRLCAIVDLPKPKIAIMQNNIPNAFTTGKNEKSAVIAITTALMKELNQSELEAVIAHELSHIKNKDMAIITIASFLSIAAFFLVEKTKKFFETYCFLEFIGRIVLWNVSKIVWNLSSILLSALSRYREFSADKGAAMITGKPSHLASALMKISGMVDRVPSQDLRKMQCMNALFIIPARNKKSIMDVFSTHPNIEARIKALSKLEESLEVL